MMEPEERIGQTNLTAHAKELVKRWVKNDRLRVIPAEGHRSLQVYVDDDAAHALDNELRVDDRPLVKIYPPSDHRDPKIDFSEFKHRVKTDPYDDDQSLSALVGGQEALARLVKDAEKMPPAPEKTIATAELFHQPLLEAEIGPKR